MKTYVGTSGWVYDWNPDGFDWYVVNSKLNAVELNASFYRFPFPNQVKGWRNKSRGRIRWSVKVSQLITHRFRFGEKAKSLWSKFFKLFEPLDEIIDFYLFQLPPSAKPTDSFLQKLNDFISFTKLGSRFALEGRREEWFKPWFEKWCEDNGIVPVSVDAPELPRIILKANDIIYLRMHGREYWYAHYYTDEELDEVINKIIEKKASKVYIFFNNNHDMLENARRMLKKLSPYVL